MFDFLGMSEKGVNTQNGIATTWNMNVGASIYQGRWSVRNPDTSFGDCVYIEKKDGKYVWTLGNCLMKMAFVCQRTSCLPRKLEYMCTYIPIIYLIRKCFVFLAKSA